MFSRTAVHILNTTPEQRKPQTMSRAISFVAGLVILCVILWSIYHG